MAVMPESARRQRISDALAAAASGASPESHRLPWQGSFATFPVVAMPLDAVVLNSGSHRIRAQLESHDESSLIQRDPYGDRAQDIIADILRTIDPEEFAGLRANLRQFTQREVGVVTRAGVLINANRRAVALRDLGQRYIRLAVLPEDADRQALDELELSLQVRREFREEYTFTNQLLFVNELLTKYRRTPDQAALELGWAASNDDRELRRGREEVQRRTRVLSLIRQVQRRSERGIPLTYFDDKLQSLTEIDRRYEDMKHPQPVEAERVRDLRLLGIIAGVGYEPLRRMDEDYIEDYLFPAISENPRLEPVLPLFRGSGETMSSPEGYPPGLDVIDAPSGPEDDSPNASAVLDAVMSAQRNVVIPADGGRQRLEISRDEMLRELRTTMEQASRTARAESRLERRVSAPLDLLRDADSRIRRAIARHPEVCDAPDFDRGRFKYYVDRIYRSVGDLRKRL